MDRRAFLGGALLTSAGAALPLRAAADAVERDWAAVRALFDLAPDRVHLGGLFFSSHPLPVRQAIERHRAGLDRDPVGYVFAHDTRERVRAVEAAARYWETSPRSVALTDSTTQGLAILYQGLALSPGDEILRTEHEHYATWYNLDLKAAACGATVRAIRLHEEDAADVDEARLVETLVSSVGPKTRVLALTWVHSSTGLKLPIAAIAAELARRGLRDRLLLCVDGVHGFGAENASMRDLGCDFFVAGCHKWLHGPRGTGVVYAATPGHWKELAPLIPPFGVKHTEGLFFSPGGFHAFEHRWALPAAFELHQRIGKARIASRVAELAGRLREGLAQMGHVRLRTPLAPALASGIVAFDVQGLSAPRALRSLGEQGIVLTRSPYGSRSLRASPAIYNTPEEIDRALETIARLRA